MPRNVHVSAHGKRVGGKITVTLETSEQCACGAPLVKSMADGKTVRRCSAGARCSAKAA